MSRALVFAGAFNPPTVAHIALADHARQVLGWDHVIFVPSKDTYIRIEQGKDRAFSNEQRLSMLEKIAEKRQWMIVSDIELRSIEQPRTYDTLCRLAYFYRWQLKLLIGSDKLPELEHGWRHVEEMGQVFGYAVLARNRDNVEAMIENDPYLTSLRPYITIIPTPAAYQDVSSSHLRRLLADPAAEQTEIKRLLPEELWQDGILDEVKK